MRQGPGPALRHRGGHPKPQVVTVQQAADDWLGKGLHGLSAATVRKNRYVPTAVLAATTSGTTLPSGDISAMRVRCFLSRWGMQLSRRSSR